MMQEEYTSNDEQADFFGFLGFPFLPVRRMAMAITGNGMDLSLYVNNSLDSCTEDGYRSPAYIPTLKLLSPSADLMARRQGSGLRMRSSKHPRNLLDGHFLTTSELQAS